MEGKDLKDKKQEKSELAKRQSRKAIIAAGVWVSVHSIMKALFPLFGAGEYGLSMSDIIKSGSFFIVGWVPVYGSIWLDKLFNSLKDNESSFEAPEAPTGFCSTKGGAPCGKTE